MRWFHGLCRVSDGRTVVLSCWRGDEEAARKCLAELSMVVSVGVVWTVVAQWMPMEG